MALPTFLKAIPFVVFLFSAFLLRQLSKFLSWLTSRLISVTSGFLPINLQMPITPAKVYFSFFSNPFVVVGQKSKVFRVGNKLLPHSNSKLPSVFVWQVFSRSQANLHQGRCMQHLTFYRITIFCYFKNHKNTNHSQMFHIHIGKSFYHFNNATRSDF